jgi:hypothetical protein
MKARFRAQIRSQKVPKSSNTISLYTLANTLEKPRMIKTAANNGGRDITVRVPQEFGKMAVRFGFTAEYLASLLVHDFCVEDPSCVWIVSDDPDTARQDAEPEELGGAF